MQKVQELYKDEKDSGNDSDGYFDAPYDYDPVLKSLGKIVLKSDEGYYEGDYLYLLKADRGWGFVIVGYGSCSGCDALQGARSWDDVQKLADDIERDVVWDEDPGVLLETAREKMEWVSWHESKSQDHFMKRARKAVRDELAGDAAGTDN